MYTDIAKRIKSTKSIKDKVERLLSLKDIVEEIENQFTYEMSLLESEIEFVLDRTPQKYKEELGYFEVSDVTQDI